MNTEHMVVEVTVAGVIVGGMSFELGNILSSRHYSRDLLQHLLDINNAVLISGPLENKMEVPVVETKKQKTSSQSLPQARVSPKKTVRKRTTKPKPSA